MKTIIRIVFLLFMLGHQVVAQHQVDGSFIKACTNQWKVTSTNAKGKQQLVYKRWTDYIQLINIDGVRHIHRVQDLYNAQGKLTDTWTNMVNHQTLLPKLSMRNNPQGGFFHYEFTQNSIIGRKSKTPKGGGVVPVKIALQKPLYDWTLYGILLVGLPLEANTSHTLSIINFQSGKPDQLKVQIKTKEKVPAGKGKTIKAWRVETNKNLVFWLSKKVPYVIRLELKNKDATLLWEML